MAHFQCFRPIGDGMQSSRCNGQPRDIRGLNFSSKDKKFLFWGDIIHANRVQLSDPEVTADFRHRRTRCGWARGIHWLTNLAREKFLSRRRIRHCFLPGRLRNEWSGMLGAVDLPIDGTRTRLHHRKSSNARASLTGQLDHRIAGPGHCNCLARRFAEVTTRMTREENL